MVEASLLVTHTAEGMFDVSTLACAYSEQHLSHKNKLLSLETQIENTGKKEKKIPVSPHVMSD